MDLQAFLSDPGAPFAQSKCVLTGVLIDAVNVLLTDDNATLCIALLIYARLNSINLPGKDIEKVRETFLNRKDPKLGELFSYFVEDNNEKAGRYLMSGVKLRLIV